MVYVFLANGFEEIEALTAVDILRRGGVQVRTVGVGGQVITGTHGVPVKADVDGRAFRDEGAEMVVLPGGLPGAENLYQSDMVKKAVLSTVERGGFAAAICAAPLVLGRMGLLVGKRATCCPGFENELTGAVYERKPAVKDGAFVTGIGPGGAHDFAFLLLSCLKGEAAAAALRAKMLYDV